MTDPYQPLRLKMVKDQIERRGIRTPTVLASFKEIPRHLFVPEDLAPYAYQDGPLPIGEGQTISQPYIVALMTEAAEIKPQDKILEIGTGSGYQAAILSKIGKEVYTIERIDALAKEAQKRLAALEIQNVTLRVGDGSLGWQEKGPFDVILVTAGAPIVPDSLIEQLADEGRLIIPVGDAMYQQLLRVRKHQGGSLTQEILESVRFVPLIGKEGWGV